MTTSAPTDCGKREGEKLLPRDVCGENERELESHAAHLLVCGLGIDSSAEAKRNDADARFAALGFSGGDGDVELDELKGHSLGAKGGVLANVETFRSACHASRWRTNAWHFFQRIVHAVENFGQGLGNKCLEVHG